MRQFTPRTLCELVLAGAFAASGGVARAEDQDQQDQEKKKDVQSKQAQQEKQKHAEQTAAPDAEAKKSPNPPPQARKQPAPSHAQPTPHVTPVAAEPAHRTPSPKPIQPAPSPKPRPQHAVPQPRVEQPVTLNRIQPAPSPAPRPAPTVVAQPQALPRHTVPTAPQRLSQQQEQQQIDLQRQRTARYTHRVERQQADDDRQVQSLLQERRGAQSRYQQQYFDDVRRQRIEMQARLNGDYSQDPYFYTAPSYSYSYDGRSLRINDYGARALGGAVNSGYQQGYASGQADHTDGWRSDARSSYAYRDAQYGFSWMYIEQDEYSYYFRQGFQRGYEDGYNTRYRYGVRDNGSLAMIGSILDQILGLRPLR